MKNNIDKIKDAELFLDYIKFAYTLDSPVYFSTEDYDLLSWIIGQAKKMEEYERNKTNHILIAVLNCSNPVNITSGKEYFVYENNDGQYIVDDLDKSHYLSDFDCMIWFKLKQVIYEN